MINKCFLVFLAFLFSVSVYSQQGRHRSSLISGRVMSTEKEVVDFATVYGMAFLSVPLLPGRCFTPC